MRQQSRACSSTRSPVCSLARAIGCTTVLALALMPQPARGQQAGTWRIARGAWAPWAAATPGELNNVTLRGGMLEFATGRVQGASPLGCGNAVYEYTLTSAEGLFQGSLPQPAAAAARSAGLTRLPVMTLAVRCDSGVFDYHYAAPDRLLVALDNVVWTLTRVSPATAPDEIVQQLLIEHMSGDMAFTAATVARKRRLLSAELVRAIDVYFRQRFPADEPPPISGDPFTNSQEYPDRFLIAGVETGEGTATVHVEFRDQSQRVKRASVLLRPSANGWLVDDLRYDDGATLRALLRPNR